MPGTVRLALAGLILAVLAFAAPVAQHHAPRPTAGKPATGIAVLAGQTGFDTVCANCI
jgi:hypothetical protein